MPEPRPSSKRSGSQRRQRAYKIGVGCNADELFAIHHNARAAGLSRAGYLRATGTGSPGPRAQRTPHINAQDLARAIAELNKIGSNLNQLTRVFNTGGATATARELAATLADIRTTAAAIRQIVGRKERA